MNEDDLVRLALLAPITSRAALLEKMCDDPDQRRRIEELVASSTEALDPGLAPTEDSDSSARPPNRLAPNAPLIAGYAISREIARGGMGRVWAGQDLALNREVAIKTLLPGASDRRFITESKLTAKLPHPGIPPVHALGKLADGSRYLVMKLIRGSTLQTQPAGPARGSELTRMLQVFGQIAQAVGFAHSTGVIHRDLKPANIMVGAFGEVQVMDWGLAKDLRAEQSDGADDGADDGAERIDSTRSSDAPLVTQYGTVMGTPAYMAPEQARGEPVDARADVFSLGVILAEVLTGVSAVQGPGIEAIRRAAQGEPHGLMEALASCDADSELIELATRCMSPTADQRPDDAQQVAAAIEGYREQVEQRLRRAELESAAAIAREKEQLKRRRFVTIAAVALTTVLLAGIIGTTFGLWEANKAAAAEVQANSRTKKRLAQIERGVDVLAGLLYDINPAHEQSGGTIYEVLADRARQAARQLDDDLVEDPVALAGLKSILGRTLVDLGAADEAKEVLLQAQANLSDELGPDHPDTVDNSLQLAFALYHSGQPTAALDRFAQVVEQRTETYGPNDPRTLTAMNHLAASYLESGQVKEAIELLEDARTRLADEASESSMMILANLGRAYEVADRLQEAISLHELAYSWYAAQKGETHYETLTTRNNLASSLAKQGEFRKVIVHLEELQRLAQGRFREDHPIMMMAANNLAWVYGNVGRHQEAIKLMRRVLELKTETLGLEHRDTLTTMDNLGIQMSKIREFDEALKIFERVIELRGKALGPTHLDTLQSLENRARVLMATKRLDEASPILKKLAEELSLQLPPEHARVMGIRNNLALIYRDTGNPAKAAAEFRRLLAVMTRISGADHHNTIITRYNLGLSLQDAGELSEACEQFEEVAQSLERTDYALGPYELLIMTCVKCYEQQDRLPEAESWRRKLAAETKQRHGADARLAKHLSELGANLLKQSRAADAVKELTECLAICESLANKASDDPLATWRLAKAKSQLGAALLANKDPQKAAPLLVQSYEQMKQVGDAAPNGERTPTLAAVLDVLIRLAEAQEDGDAAARWKVLRKQLNE